MRAPWQPLHPSLQPRRADERTSLIITTNLAFAKWLQVFADAKMTTALVDRLSRHCEIIDTGTSSCRFRHTASSAHNLVKFGR